MTPEQPIALRPPSIRSTLDRPFVALAALATLVSAAALGLSSAIIPNPVFGRTIPPDGFAIAVWLASAPLMGILLATFVRTPRVFLRPEGRDAGATGLTVGSLATFFAVGCPVCNKIVLLALGTSGALSVFAPIQPLIGGASLLVLAVSARWALRRRALGCALGQLTQ